MTFSKVSSVILRVDMAAEWGWFSYPILLAALRHSEFSLSSLVNTTCTYLMTSAYVSSVLTFSWFFFAIGSNTFLTEYRSDWFLKLSWMYVRVLPIKWLGYRWIMSATVKPLSWQIELLPASNLPSWLASSFQSHPQNVYANNLPPLPRFLAIDMCLLSRHHCGWN